MRRFLFASVATAASALAISAKGDVIVGFNFNNRNSSPSTVAPGLASTSFGRYYENQYGGPGGEYAPLYGGQGASYSYDGSNYQITYDWADSGQN